MIITGKNKAVAKKSPMLQSDVLSNNSLLTSFKYWQIDKQNDMQNKRYNSINKTFKNTEMEEQFRNINSETNHGKSSHSK